MYIYYSIGNNSGPRTLVRIVEVSVIGGVRFRMFHCIASRTNRAECIYGIRTTFSPQVKCACVWGSLKLPPINADICAAVSSAHGEGRVCKQQILILSVTACTVSSLRTQ